MPKPILLPTSLVGSYPQPDWLIDREAQKDGTIYTGIRGFFNNQDIMATQTAFTDRTKSTVRPA